MVVAAIGMTMARRFVSPNHHRIVQQTLLARLCPIQAAGICGKALRDKDYQKPAPYPYKEKKYGLIEGFLDRTTKRFDENTKVIFVEGPVAAGKTAFAKALADDLDMMHFPEANMDLHYINSYGYDMRQLDSQLPESCRSFDAKNFCENPNHTNVANFQIQMYILRYMQYVDALAHLFSTGQGIVMERSCYSDFVFLEAMVANGFVSKGARSVYYDLRNNSINQLMRPHLVIYLDVPVNTCLDRIKKRALPHEAKSKALTPQYLQAMEEQYKQRYLKEISAHAELLVYDWSSYGDAEVVVEDIERIDFDRFEKHDSKMSDWRLDKEWDYNVKRREFTSERYIFESYFNVPRFDVPELVISGDDTLVKKRVWYNAPGMKFRKGYNADLGDSGTLLKTKMDFRET